MNRPDSKNVSTSSHYHRVLTQDEIMREGLAGRRRPVLDVINNGTDTGRGVVAKEAIPKGSYVCEYKTSAVYPAREKEKHDKVHECNDAGSYVVETFYSILKVGKLCFDATEHFHHPGRYMNYVGRDGNLRSAGHL